MGTFLRNLRRSGSSDDLAELQQLVSRLDSQRDSLSNWCSTLIARSVSYSDWPHWENG